MKICNLFPDGQVHILSDSIAKYVTGIDHTILHAFPGINISRLMKRIERFPELVYSDFTILHVGTNDVTTLSVIQILSAYNNLFCVISSLSPTKIVVSSILPRPLDHSKYGENVKAINAGLKKICSQRKLQFIHSFRPFFKFGQPVRELFAVRDGGLHLNLEGTRRLKLVFINTVAHLLK